MRLENGKSIVAIALLAFGASGVLSGTVDIPWFTIDGGSAWSAGGVFIMAGTIGQVDAGPLLTGGTFRLEGGFLPATRRFAGDTNCDCVVNFADINPFVIALSDPDEYKRQYPCCDINNADCNGNGQINFADINCFVELIGGNQ